MSVTGFEKSAMDFAKPGIKLVLSLKYINKYVCKYIKYSNLSERKKMQIIRDTATNRNDVHHNTI